MTTPFRQPRYAQIAQAVNAVLAESFLAHGAPRAAEFSIKHNAVILHYDTLCVIRIMEIRQR